MRIVSYLRVSTAQQGRSGLGLAAQRDAIEAFASSRRATILQTFTEVESGCNGSRVELGKAINLEAISELPEQQNSRRNLHKPEEILGMELPAVQ